MFIIGPSYYVVHFDEDDCIARVPRKSVLKPARPSVGETCSIEWSDGVEYTATVLAMGKSLLLFLHCSLRLCLHSIQLIAISVMSQRIHNR